MSHINQSKNDSSLIYFTYKKLTDLLLIKVGKPTANRHRLFAIPLAYCLKTSPSRKMKIVTSQRAKAEIDCQIANNGEFAKRHFEKRRLWWSAMWHMKAKVTIISSDYISELIIITLVKASLCKSYDWGKNCICMCVCVISFTTHADISLPLLS